MSYKPKKTPIIINPTSYAFDYELNEAQGREVQVESTTSNILHLDTWTSAGSYN